MELLDFFNKLPENVDSATLSGLETCFHFDLGGSKAARITVSVQDGKLLVDEGLNGDPKCVISGDGETFLKILKKEINPMTAFFTGKIKASNTGEILKFANILGLM